MSKRPVLFSDGSVYPAEKGWDAYFAVVLDDGTPAGRLLRHASVGNATISMAEYLGVIWALEWSKGPCNIITDSNLIIGHVFKNWKCIEHLQPYRDKVKSLLSKYNSSLHWESRDNNKAGKFFETIQKRRKREHK